MPITKGRLDEIGERLRQPGVPQPADLEGLHNFRDGHLPVLALVLCRLNEANIRHAFSLSARQKNAQTMIAKLRTEKSMELSNMQDVAGARMVLMDGGLEEQDEVLHRIQEVFPKHKQPKDRRAEPKAGYRAVHVVVKEGGYWAEIQIRTLLQDRWAQMFERLGDHWGRQIRYGGAPNNPESMISINGAKVTRSEVVRYMIEASIQISDLEEIERNVKQREDQFEVVSCSDPYSEMFQRSSIDADLAAMDEARTDVEGLLEAVGEVAPGTSVAWVAPIEKLPPSAGDGDIRHFLVAYSRSTGTLESVRQFLAADVESMIAERSAIEAAHHGDENFEVVLLASSSSTSLVQTHARYFKNLAQLAIGKG